jgi:Spy/CpxP family protein refolding chaperone
MGEFSGKHAPTPVKTSTPAPSRSPLNRAQLAAEIERLRPQIDGYRQRLEALDAEFDRELIAHLTPEQAAAYTAGQKRRADRSAKGAAQAAAKLDPFTDDEIEQLRQRSLFGVLWMIAPTMKQDSLIKDLKLTDAQQLKTRELLRDRREKFLAIVDSTPPPSIMLSRLAPAAQRLAPAPAKK